MAGESMAIARKIEIEMYRIALRFSASVDPVVARRIQYIFSTFCAVYGFGMLREPVQGSPCIYYGQGGRDSRQVIIPGFYQWRSTSIPAPQPVWIASDINPILGAIGIQRFPRFFGPIESTDVDWLGEAFEWLSSADEYAINETDSIGRVPYARTLHGRYDIDPVIPWAGVCFAALNHQIQLRWPNWPKTPQGIFPGSALTIGASHDIDFLPIHRKDPWTRLLKNIIIAAALYRDIQLLKQIVLKATIGMHPRLKSSLETCIANELERGIRSGYNVIVPFQRHRRDTRYSLSDTATINILSRIQNMGMEIGLHGSYLSLDEPGLLAREAAMLRDAGFNPLGGRQHWLRYRVPALFREATRAGLKYDTSVGYPDRPGFRSGACFPYAPYDFETESCYPILEIPLVIMDSSLSSWIRTSEQLDAICNPIISALRRFGWGGVSILWHDPVLSGMQVRQCIGDHYWKLFNPCDSWVAPCEIEKRFWPRMEAVMSSSPLQKLNL